MFLETKRLILRKIRESDFPDFCDFAMDDNMCRMMGREPMPDTAAARVNFDWLKDKEPRGYALVYKETGRVIGNLTVCAMPSYLAGRRELEGKSGCSLSFSISRHYQRRGLMQEAVSAVIDQLFLAEGLDYINCGHFSFNVPSRELQRKLGFVFLFSDRIQINGEEIMCFENVLWKQQWLERRENPPRQGQKA